MRSVNTEKDKCQPAIHPSAVIDSSVLMGVDCIVGPGAVLPAGVRLGSRVSIGANAVFVPPSEGALVKVGADVRIGANATIYPGLLLADKCVVSPGAVVMRSVPPGAIVEGNPASITGYVNTVASDGGALQSASKRASEAEKTVVRGVTVHQFPLINDLRGNLTVGEFQSEVPFVPLRYFMVFGVPSREIRGEHAHHACQQFLICVRGSCAVVADDGKKRVEVFLDSPDKGVYLPPLTWGIQYKYSQDAILLVFASHHYDAGDYIRNYEEFLNTVSARGSHE